jgi:hypothetical protein
MGFTGDVASLEPWERIQMVADYYGWANFGEYDELTEGEIRWGTLRRALS